MQLFIRIYIVLQLYCYTVLYIYIFARVIYNYSIVDNNSINDNNNSNTSLKYFVYCLTTELYKFRGDCKLFTFSLGRRP